LGRLIEEGLVNGNTAWILALALFFAFLAFAVWTMRARRVQVSVDGIAKASVEGDIDAARTAASVGSVTTGHLKAGGDVRALAYGEPIRTGNIDAQGNVDLQAGSARHPKAN